jgi:hypothetical protein
VADRRFYPPAVFYVDAPKMQAYAARNFDFEYVKFEYLDAEKRVDQVLAYYREVKPKKAFVWVHFFEPHEPYVTHEGSGSAPATSSATTARSPTPTRRWGGSSPPFGPSDRRRWWSSRPDHGEEFDEHGGRYHGSTLYEEQLRIPSSSRSRA